MLADINRRSDPPLGIATEAATPLLHTFSNLILPLCTLTHNEPQPEDR